MTMMRKMSKVEFMYMSVDLLEEHAKTGYKNPKYNLKLSDFHGWDEWFGFGEWDHGARIITVHMSENNVNGIAFLKKHGFV